MSDDEPNRTLPLYGEQVQIMKNEVISDRVCVAASVDERTILIEGEVERGSLVVERVKVDLPVASDKGCADRLAALVTRAFPLLALGERRLDRSGGDHLVLVADDRHVFRFPRMGVRDLALEIELLRELQARSTLPTPVYQYVDPLGRFAGYPLIAGDALTPQRFAALPSSRQETVLRVAAQFLVDLHTVSPDAVAPAEHWPLAWTAAQFASRATSKYLPDIRDRLPEQARRAASFYARYAELGPVPRVVVHGDLVPEHMLLDEEGQRLAGIIDFGDVALGDPAQDFLGFWAYGPDAAAQAVAIYGLADAGLLDRSRNHFIRYRLDRLLGDMDLSSIDTRDLAAGIDALLAFDTPHLSRR